MSANSANLEVRLDSEVHQAIYDLTGSILSKHGDEVKDILGNPHTAVTFCEPIERIYRSEVEPGPPRLFQLHKWPEGSTYPISAIHANLQPDTPWNVTIKGTSWKVPLPGSDTPTNMNRGHFLADIAPLDDAGIAEKVGQFLLRLETLDGKPKDAFTVLDTAEEIIEFFESPKNDGPVIWRPPQKLLAPQ